MSIIKPFKAIRPSADKAEQVSSHSIERYSASTIQDILTKNPFSFLHVIYAGRDNKNGYHEQLKTIKAKFEDFINEGIFEREEKLKEYLTICDFNAEPVCLTHPYSKELDDLLKKESHKKPLYNFTSQHIHHSVWKISETQEIKVIEDIFKNMPYLYIADGHHRAASSTLYADMQKRANSKHTGEEAYNFFTAAFFAETELTIFNFDRMVSSLNNHTTESFLVETALYFDIITKV